MALELRKVGYEAYALLGGYDAWRDAGLPVEPLEGATPHPATP